jgi:hypothetical protein
MGKKKSFIDKKSSQTFSVVHRSQRDAGGEDASPFVLIPHERKHPPASGARIAGICSDDDDDDAGGGGFGLGMPSAATTGARGGGGGGGKAAAAGKAARTRDHINELGLPNDGYDYAKHMRATGGGTFVEAGGKVRHFASAGARAATAAAVPLDALPSTEARHTEMRTKDPITSRGRGASHRDRSPRDGRRPQALTL